MKSSPPSRSPRSDAPPRSASTSAPAPGGARGKSSSKKGLPAPPLSANERGVQRRAKRKKQQKRKSWLVWLGFVALSAMLAGVALGVDSAANHKLKWPHFKGVLGEYKEVRAKVRTKQATLQDLRAELARARKRLAGFNKGSGRERALAENGFVRPGERILLFPTSPDEPR